jgi:hypothetical protein
MEEMELFIVLINLPENRSGDLKPKERENMILQIISIQLLFYTTEFYSLARGIIIFMPLILQMVN